MRPYEDHDPLKIVISAAKYRFLKEGFYKAKVARIKPGLGNYNNAIFDFEFEIAEGEEIGAPIHDWVNQSATSHGGKLWKLVKVLTGKSLNESEGFILDDLIGCECFIHVEGKPKQGKGKSNVITEYVSIADFRDIEKRYL